MMMVMIMMTVMMTMTTMTMVTAAAAATTATYLLRRNTFSCIFGPTKAIHSENLDTKNKFMTDVDDIFLT